MIYIYIYRQVICLYLSRTLNITILSLQLTHEIIKSKILSLENDAHTRLSHASCVNTFCYFHSFYKRIIYRTHAWSLLVCTLYTPLSRVYTISQ